MGKKLWQSVAIRIGFFCKYKAKNQYFLFFFSSIKCNFSDSFLIE